MLKKLFIFTVLLFGLSLTTFGIALEEWKWGFDGTVDEDHINPLSAMISNPAPIPFDGAVTLQKINFMGKPVGAPLIKKVFLAPYASRWIQFYPYIRSASGEKWMLSWGKGANQRAVIKIGLTKGRAIVYLTDDPLMMRKGKIRLPFFKENLFPPTVAATSGLYGVVIDKIPEFTPLQRQAFHDWLYRGGKVYIAPSDGGYPNFGSDYAYLNIKGSHADAGSGEITVIPPSMKLINASTLKGPTTIKAGSNTIYMQNSADSFFRKLRSQLKTNHNWILIFLISILYGLLITIVNFIIGRRSRTPWKPIIFFLSVVTVFSLLLAWCGRRGYGEKTHILAFTYARELDPGHFDLEQWMDIFVTSSDYYKISHKNGNNIYADCQTENRINGEIYNGKEGLFLVDIPLFSSMQLFHRMDAYTANPVNVDLSYRTNGDFASLDLTLDPHFPKPVIAVTVVVDGKVYPMTVGDAWNKFHNKPDTKSQTVSEYIRKWDENDSYYGYYSDEEPDKVFKSMIPPLIIRSRGGDEVIDDYYPTASATDDKADIFVLTKTPEEFKAKCKMIESEDGYTLFHFIRPVN